MHSECQHQSIHRISVEGKRPEGSEWYECKNKKCGIRMLVTTVVELPRSTEQKEAEHSGVRLISKAMADDGTTWDSVALAKRRNALLKSAAEVNAFLLPRTPELEQGNGYIQQDPLSVDEFRIRLTRLVSATVGKEEVVIPTLDSFLESNVEEQHPFHALNDRLKCIDSQNREWQSPFLAQHPEEGKQVLLISLTPSKEETHHEQRESG